MHQIELRVHLQLTHIPPGWQVDSLVCQLFGSLFSKLRVHFGCQSKEIDIESVCIVCVCVRCVCVCVCVCVFTHQVCRIVFDPGAVFHCISARSP